MSNLIEVEALRDFQDIFLKGDKLQVQPVLYEKDTTIVKATRPIDNVGFGCDATIASKGSYKGCKFILSDGREYNCSLLRGSLDKYFKKK